MEEINPFVIDENTEPSYKSDVAKWYLLKKGRVFALWRWDSLKDVNDKRFLITNKKTSVVINEGYQLTEMLDKLDIFEAALKEEE